METKLFSIYGARLSKDKKRVNISIVSGDDDDKEFGCISLKLNNKQKTHVKVDGDNVLVKVPMLPKDTKKGKKTDNKSKDVDDDLPW